MWCLTSSSSNSVSNGLPERARLARRPLVSDRLPHEDEAPCRPGAGGREQVAVAARLIGADEPPAVMLVERAARVVVEERLDARPSGKRALLEPEDENGVVAPRAGAQEIEDGDTAGCPGGSPRTVVRSRAASTSRLPTSHPAAARASSSSSVRETASCASRSASERRSTGGDSVPWAFLRSRSASARRTSTGRLVGGGEVIGRNGPAATQLDGDLDRPVASHDPASPQLALDPVDVAPRQPGVRRAQVRVERGPLPASHANRRSESNE